MRALVAGGAGFIGSSLVERLLAEQHEVDVVDDLSTGSLANLSRARAEGAGQLKIHQADIRDEGISALFERRAPEVVFHLAGATAKRGRTVTGQVAGDVATTVAVLDAAAEAGASKVVCVASARKQTDEIRGIAARAVQEYLEAYRHRFGLEYTTLVLPTVYGPRQTAATESSVVAVFVERVLDGEACVLHDDGRPAREFLFVDDAVDALVRASTSAGRQVIEVGTGEPVTIRDLYAAVATAFDGVALDPVSGDRRRLEPGTVGTDPALAHELLDWAPWTSLIDGLAATISEARAART